MKMKSTPVTQVAESLINGPRAETYGPAAENFTRISETLNGLFHTRFKDGKKFHAVDACLIMVVLKLSRISYAAENGRMDMATDSIIDAIGYLALIQKVMETIADEKAD